MSTAVTINDVAPKSQFTATNLQTVFSCNWTANATTDILVYARAAGVAANDLLQLISSSDYNVTFIGGTETVRVTFAVGRTTGDVVTVVRNTPADRTNLYVNANFTPAMLNQDFGILTLVDQQNKLYDRDVAPRYQVSATISLPQDIPNSEKTGDTVLPILVANQIWAKNNANDAIIAYDVPASGGVAPKTAKYLIQTSTSELPDAQAMGALASGLVVNTTTTGIQLTRTLTGTSNQITITNGTGIAGDPTIAIADDAKIGGTAGLGIPTGTTVQRPGAPVGTELRHNITIGSLEYWDGVAWAPINDGGDVDSITGTSNEVLVNGTSGVPIQGAITLTVGSSLAALSVLASTGFIAQTGANTFADRTLTGTANQIDITNTAGVAGNPAFTVSSTLNLPGSFAIQGTTAISAIINDSTLATASATNVSTAAAMKAYIDAVATGLNIQGSCVAASTVALTVTYDNGVSGVGATLTNAGVQAAISLDGVSPTVGQRVLIKDQVSTFQVGIYTVTTVGTGATNWVLTRATDFDTPAEIQPGDLVILTGGATQANSSWLQTETVATVGTDAIAFIQFSLSIPVSVPNGGTGLTTLAINTILYASSANVMSALAAANSAVLSTGAGGIPILSTTLPSGIAASGMLLTSPRIITSLLDTNGNTLLGVTATGSAVNHANLRNNIAGGSPILEALGADTNVQLMLQGKGTSGAVVQGITSGSFATAGFLGERITASVLAASAVSVTTLTSRDVTSIVLTAGNWMVSGVVCLAGSGAVQTQGISWISTTTAALPDNSLRSGLTAAAATIQLNFVANTIFLNLSAASTTVYLSCYSVFASGTVSASGIINAIRI